MSCTTIFRVRTPPSSWGSGIALTGSSPHLSSWSLNQTPPLPLTFTPPFFTLTLTLPANSYFEYKYVSVSSTNAIISWEQLAHGGNRHFKTPAAHHTLLIDDDIIGNDASAKRTLIPPPRASTVEDTKPIVKPRSTVSMCDQDYEELVLNLNRTAATVKKIHEWIRHVKGLPPLPTGEEWSTDLDGVAEESWDEKELIQGCLDDGYALVELLQAKRPKQNGPSGGAIAGALVVAVGVTGGAVVSWSPQVGREGSRRVFDVWRVVIKEGEGWYRWGVHKWSMVKGVLCQQFERVNWLAAVSWCMEREAEQGGQRLANDGWWAKLGKWDGIGRWSGMGS
eukprot:GFKZ01006419.1.p1 GENE.GFKZ01006419.1~~GFKZ01006419.1.p1  ORF type:complete len:337 (-),score=30.88 GFKZ01006419.1:1007-2017(-)